MNGKIRNKRCPCGSGKKYKHCCYDSDRQAAKARSDEHQRILSAITIATRQAFLEAGGRLVPA